MEIFGGRELSRENLLGNIWRMSESHTGLHVSTFSGMCDTVVNTLTDIHTDIHTDRQTQRDSQTHRQTDRQTHRDSQTHRQTAFDHGCTVSNFEVANLSSDSRLSYQIIFW